MILTEFDQKKYEKTIRKESYEDGLEAGIDDSMDIVDAINAGTTDESELVEMGYAPETVKKVLARYLKNK